MKVWIRTALINFFIAACLGALLRFAFVVEIPWMKYQYVQHAHSHVAMLGWVYLALYALIVHRFLTKEQQQARIYQSVFWLTQGSVIGMLVTFPLMGYAGWSIFFSTLQIVFSYIFLLRFWRDLNRNKTGDPYAKLFIKAALFFLFLSTLALWGMGPIIALGFKGKPVYYMAVQFFLHFQFNGWFLFAILGLLFQWLGQQGWRPAPSTMNSFFYVLMSATILTYALVIIWSHPLTVLYWVNGLGVSLQLIALGLLVFMVKKAWIDSIKKERTWVRVLFLVAAIAFILKVLFQFTVVFPAMTKVSFTIRNYVIGFIHLLNLGIVSCFILGYSLKHERLSWSRIGKVGLSFFLAGLIGIEILLFLQGSLLWSAIGFLPYYYESLFGISALLALGLGLLILQEASFFRAIASRILEALS